MKRIIREIKRGADSCLEYVVEIPELQLESTGASAEQAINNASQMVNIRRSEIVNMSLELTTISLELSTWLQEGKLNHER